MNEPATAISVVPIQAIMALVGDHYGVTRLDLLSPSRLKQHVRPRHVAMYLARHLTLFSHTDIGAAFGGRDNHTVKKSIGNIAARTAHEPGFAAEVNALLTALGGRSPPPANLARAQEVAWTDPIIRAARGEAIREACGETGYREKRSRQMREAWARRKARMQSQADFSTPAWIPNYLLAEFRHLALRHGEEAAAAAVKAIKAVVG